MFRILFLMSFLALCACGKPAEIGLTGPIPTSSDWPFGDQSHIVFQAIDSDKDFGLSNLEITKALRVSRFRQSYKSGAFSEGEIWFHKYADSQRIGVAQRSLTQSIDGKTIESIKEPMVYYDVYDPVPNRTPLRIKWSDAFCPLTKFDEKKPEEPLRPLHACQAKNAELTWALITQYPDMLSSPQMLEIVNSQ